MRARNMSYLNAVQQSDVLEESGLASGSKEQVAAGLQNVLQVFITNSANVFLLEPSETEVHLEEQVSLKRFQVYIHMHDG